MSLPFSPTHSDTRQRRQLVIVTHAQRAAASTPSHTADEADGAIAPTPDVDSDAPRFIARKAPRGSALSGLILAIDIGERLAVTSRCMQDIII
jgi:hypothetical protein